MSGFLLDTNVPSETLRPRPNANVSAWIKRQPKDVQFLSVVSVGELRRGFILMPPGRQRTRLEQWLEQDLLPLFAGRILPVTLSIGDRWGVLDAQRQLRGRPLNTADGMIAATALEHGLTVVTRNVKDFSDLGLSVLNPWDAI
jgi:predicted nucleic acid-binding protein